MWEQKNQEAGLEMVSSQPYYNEEDYPFFGPLVDASMDQNTVSENYGNEVNPLMLMGPNPYPRNITPGKEVYPSTTIITRSFVLDVAVTIMCGIALIES